MRSVDKLSRIFGITHFVILIDGAGTEDRVLRGGLSAYPIPYKDYEIDPGGPSVNISIPFYQVGFFIIVNLIRTYSAQGGT